MPYSCAHMTTVGVKGFLKVSKPRTRTVRAISLLRSAACWLSADGLCCVPVTADGGWATRQRLARRSAALRSAIQHHIVRQRPQHNTSHTLHYSFRRATTADSVAYTS